MGNSKINGRYIDRIEGAVVMTESNLSEFVRPKRHFHWETFLPKRKAWIQTLMLLPFGLPIGNFLGVSWQFSVNAIVEDRQYPIGALALVVSLLLPSLMFAFLFQWGRAIRYQQASTWYPNARAFGSGVYATLTIAASFGIVTLCTHSLGICSNLAWSGIGQALLCNLDGYGFESKSWFGIWFIVAAYCYQAQGSIKSSYRRIFRRQDPSARFLLPAARSTDLPDFNSVATVGDDFGSHQSIESISTNRED
jgi:hypothetical protein